MTLCRQIVYFRGLNGRHEFHQATGVGHVAVVQVHFTTPVAVLVLVQVVNPGGVETAGSPDDAVHLVSFVEKELGEVRTVLED